MISFVTILVVAASLAWILYPMFRNRQEPYPDLLSVETSERRRVLEEKARLYLILRELDFDYESKKLSADDYKELRTKYEAETVEILKRLETYQSTWDEIQGQIDQDLERHRTKYETMTSSTGAL